MLKTKKELFVCEQAIEPLSETTEGLLVGGFTGVNYFAVLAAGDRNCTHGACKNGNCTNPGCAHGNCTNPGCTHDNCTNPGCTNAECSNPGCPTLPPTPTTTTKALFSGVGLF